MRRDLRAGPRRRHGNGAEGERGDPVGEEIERRDAEQRARHDACDAVSPGAAERERETDQPHRPADRDMKHRRRGGAEGHPNRDLPGLGSGRMRGHGVDAEHRQGQSQPRADCEQIGGERACVQSAPEDVLECPYRVNRGPAVEPSVWREDRAPHLQPFATFVPAGSSPAREIAYAGCRFLASPACPILAASCPRPHPRWSCTASSSRFRPGESVSQPDFPPARTRAAMTSLMMKTGGALRPI